MSLKLYKYFSSNQQWPLILEALEYRLSKRIPGEIKIKKAFLNQLIAANIPFAKNDKGIEIEYQVNENLYKFFLRNNGSDISVFIQILFREEYKPLISLFKRLNLSITNFIDAGANVGFSSLYLSAFFPNSTFICLEPNPGNFAALSHNIGQNIKENNFILLQKALWNKSVQLSGSNDFRDGKDWSFSVKEESGIEGDIEGVTMDWILQKYNFDEVDFLKIDIEGAEASLFENKRSVESWIDKIKVMAIEIHEETTSGFKIENMLQNFGCRIYHCGELTIAVNKKLTHLLLNDE